MSLRRIINLLTQPRSQWDEVVAMVEHQLPEGVQLSDRAVVMRYPDVTTYNGGKSRGGIFCYEFFSTEGKNVATWLSGMNGDPQIHINEQIPRGRTWGDHLPKDETVPVYH